MDVPKLSKCYKIAVGPPNKSHHNVKHANGPVPVDLAPNLAPRFFVRFVLAETFSQATTQTQAGKDQETPIANDGDFCVYERIQIMREVRQTNEERAQQYAEEPDVHSDGSSHTK